MKKFDEKAVVATAIGAAIFFVLARFVTIPTWIPNTNVNVQYGFLALFSAIFGPLPALLVGFIGHWLTDVSFGGIVWFSWISGSALFGVVLGTFMLGNKVDKGEFGKADKVKLVIGTLVANAVAWLVVAPAVDVTVYGDPADKAFLQGLVAGVANTVTTIVVGYLLLEAYSRTRTKSGSLSAK